MITLTCIKTLPTKHLTFKEGETYNGNQVNDNWWVVDSVGVENNKINEYFKV